MKYPAELYRKAEEILRDRRRQAEEDLRSRKESLRAEHPELYTMYRETKAAAAEMGRRFFTAKPEEIDKMLEAQDHRHRELDEALAAAGLVSGYLQELPGCPVCRDYGFVGSTSCRCRNEILNRLAYDWLSNASQVQDCSLDNFRLDYYRGDTAKAMKKLLAACRRYIECFSLRSPNLLFTGPTGLGKTHLSLAIAREVVEQGYLVLYASAPMFFDRLAAIHFGNEKDTEYRDIAYGCDLLIVDDLGAEMQTSYTRTETYGLINARLIEGRPTIINTNLTMAQLEKAYDQRVVSRLVGDYVLNLFDGKDIRVQKRLENTSQRRLGNAESEETDQ